MLRAFAISVVGDATDSNATLLDELEHSLCISQRAIQLKKLLLLVAFQKHRR